jgi:hypothetical protein
MVKFRKDHADSNVIATERCFVPDGTIFYAVRFEEEGKQQEALLTPEAKVVMVYDKGEAPPRQLLLADTLGPSTEFRLFRRKPDGEWGESASYARAIGMEAVRALEGARLWDGTNHVHDQTMPDRAIGLDWSSDVSQRKTRAVWICKGNRLFWHTDAYYEVPKNSWKLMDKAFSENQ